MPMPRSFRVFQVDAFTNRPFCGNPAGVVLDADSLEASEMQAIARELNNGDTAFLLAADGDDHDLRVRFFTPRTEAGFVGHATLAAHAVLASLGLPERPRQKQRTGIVTISRGNAVACGGDSAGNGQSFGFAQPPPRLQGPLAIELLTRALAALGLAGADLDQRLPPVVVGEASTRLLVALSDPARLATLQPDLGALAACSADGAPPGFFAYAVTGAGESLGTEARMYCPALGINEDPVSGNAHAMLAHWLCARGLLDARMPIARFTGRQGHHMGRPGSLHVEVASEGNTPRSIRISGEAAIVFEARLSLPAA
jgi:PhzF family phenazine biosynthesis protein